MKKANSVFRKAHNTITGWPNIGDGWTDAANSGYVPDAVVDGYNK